MKIEVFNVKKIARNCMDKVFRTSTDKPGFIEIDFGKNISSNQLRAIMVELKKELSKNTRKRFNKKLIYHWLVRFDQQVNTPYHVDNAEDQSFLMLGYEPSQIDSVLYLADYYKYARESAKAPKDYLKNFTPIFEQEESWLAPYSSKVKPFEKDTYKIVLINNSNPKSNRETLGVFHKAHILNSDLGKSRIVNSMIVNLVPLDAINDTTYDEEDFIKTTVISK